MKILWNSFKIAFSMYSKIPMPYSDWKKENMRYAMGFFPLIGIVTGIGVYLLSFLFERVSIAQGSLFRAAALTVLPILITGGIHMDGFLDVSDAMSSYQERERRLEILKDSHAGAFAIICGLCYLILYFGAVSVITTEMFPVVGIGFVLVRANSGLSIVTFKMAKNTACRLFFRRRAETGDSDLDACLPDYMCGFHAVVRLDTGDLLRGSSVSGVLLLPEAGL